MSWLTAVIWGVGLIVHVILAGAVLGDAQKLQREGRATFLLSPPVWSLIVLASGVLAFIAYWLIHYSSLGITTPSNRT